MAIVTIAYVFCGDRLVRKWENLFPEALPDTSSNPFTKGTSIKDLIELATYC
jgi:hypothetical protein